MSASNAENLKARIMEEAVEMKLPCQKAFKIAAEAGCEPAEVGKICNDADVKIVSCQLGCF